MATKSTRQKQFFSIFLIITLLVPMGGFGLAFFTNGGSFNSEGLSSSDAPSDVNFSLLPQIDYEGLNQSWYNQDIEMLIIVPDGNQEFVNVVEPLAEWKNNKGVKTLILSNYSEYDGEDGPEKIRNMIKSYYESDGIRWVLLAGDAQDDLIPIRYVHNWDTGNIVEDNEKVGVYPTQELNNRYKPTDYYYADLTGTWDSNNNSIYGESAKYNDNGEDEIEWTPEVYVGRFPANNANELSAMVNKTLNYEKHPEIGDWMNRMLLAGAVSERSGDGEDEARLTTFIWQNYVEGQMNFTHLCRTTSYYTAPEPKEYLTRTTFRSEFNKGYSTVIFAGHGNDDKFNDIYGTIYNLDDASSCSNFNKPSLIYADACTTSPYDYNDNNLGETLIKKLNRGTIGYVGAMRLSLYYNNDEELEALNRGNAKLFWKVFFENRTYKQGKTLYDSKMAYMNSHYYKYERNLDHEQAERKQLLTYNLLGDPEVDIYTDVPGKVTENPFPSTLYEGQMVNITVIDDLGRPVANPRLFIYNKEEGISRTVYGDGSGNVKFRLPPISDITYNVAISGHNLLRLSNFTISVLPDNEAPVIRSAELTTPRPSVSTELHFQINTTDDASGIESLFVLFSKDNFNNYFYYQISNTYDKDQTYFDFKTDKFEPGTYEYLVYARDYTNKSDVMYDPSFQISIAIPISYYVLLGSVIGIAGIAVASTLLYSRNIKHYPDKLRKLRRTQG